MTQLLIILILTFFSLVLINYKVLYSLLEKNKDIDQYKINHFIWAHCFFLMPVPILIGLFYFVWLYNISFIFDLRVLGVIPYLPDLLPFKDSLWFIYLLFFVIFFNIIVLILLVLVVIYKHYRQNCFKLLIYYYHPPSVEEESRDSWDLFLSETIRNLIDKLPWLQLGYKNIFAETIYIMSDPLMILLYGNDYKSQLPKNHLYRIFYRFLRDKDRGHTLLLMSPLIFILYDCIYNNYIISHVFYYLIIFIPVLLFRRFTTFMMEHLQYLCKALWRIYYSKQRLLFAILPEVKPLLEYYLASGLKRNIDIGLEVDFDLYYQMLFFPLREDNLFHNNDGSAHVMLTPENKVYEAIFNGDDTVSIGAEWVLIAFINGDKPYNI